MRRKFKFLFRKSIHLINSRHYINTKNEILTEFHISDINLFYKAVPNTWDCAVPTLVTRHTTDVSTVPRQWRFKSCERLFQKQGADGHSTRWMSKSEWNVCACPSVTFKPKMAAGLQSWATQRPDEWWVMQNPVHSQNGSLRLSSLWAHATAASCE